MSSSGFGDTKGCLHVKITWMGLQDTDGNTNRTTFHQPTSQFQSSSYDLGPPHWPRVFTK
jgi:hypothetical protein